MSTFYYFAYGSNMLVSRLKERCPSARGLGVVELKKHELLWHKKSKDGSGKCCYSPQIGASIFGVLFEISNSEHDKLDKAEGVGHGYERTTVTLLHDGTDVVAQTYAATATDSLLKPYSWYKDFVIAGAEEHNFPPHYIDLLKQVECIEDPDKSRDQENRSLLNNGSL